MAQALHELDGDRQIGMIAGRIPWTAIDQWMRHPDRRDLDVAARTILTEAIGYVDAVELAERAKRTPPPAARPPRGPVARAARGAGR